MKIITSVVNNPTFIEIQFHTLKKYFKGEYEFIVFNDAKNYPDFTNGGDVTIKNQIQKICSDLDIQCINVDNNHHIRLGMSSRHADTFNNHVLKYQLNNPDEYLMIDSDMFLMDTFDIDKYSKFDAAIVLQKRQNEEYLWPGLCYLNMNKIKHFELINWSLLPGFDSGGMTKNWLKKQNYNDIYFIDHLSSCKWNENKIPKALKNNSKLITFLQNDERNQNDNFFCEIYDDVFLHYRAGGNWRREGLDLHKSMSIKLKKCLL